MSVTPAAHELASKTVAQLQQSKAAIESRAESLYRDGAEQAETEFAPSASRSSLESEIRGWIREQAAKGDGLVKIREAMRERKDVAAVIYHSPSFLVGLGSKTHSSLRFDAVEQHLPAAYKKLTDSASLRELAPKYDKAISSVRTSFYSPVLAEKARLRVEI